MTNRPVDAQVSVPFATNVESTPIILEQSASDDTGQNPFEGWIAVREFPVLNGVTRNASVGTIQDSGNVVQLTRNEYIEFQGTDTSNVTYPFDNASRSVSVEVAFDLGGDAISAAQLSFTMPAGNSIITANQPFIGLVRVEYFSTYRVLAYLPNGGADFGAFGDAFFRRYGTIISIKDTSFATLNIEPATPQDFSLYKELYRLTSTVDVNDNGAWERHPDFDTGGSWNENAPVQGGNLFSYERPHEIGYVVRATAGRVDYRTTNPFQEQGPTSSFLAELTLRFHGAGEFAGTPWDDAYSRADIGAVQSDVLARWSGYTINVV